MSLGVRIKDQIEDIVSLGDHNDQVFDVDVYDDEELSFGVALDEQGIVGLRHFEADFMKILG